MEVLIIGHSVRDYIHTGDQETSSPGGIYYSVLGALSCADENDELHLLTASDKETSALFSSVYDRVDHKYFDTADKIPVVHLRILDDAERCEYYENITKKLNIENVKDFSSFDGILINMITGFDISAEDLTYIRSRYSGLIYLDIHTLARGLDDNNARNFRLIPESEIWLSSVDILQVNEHELFTLFAGNSEIEVVSKALRCGLKYLILTKGHLGVRVFWLENGGVNSFYHPALKIETKNKVGCGDIFGSVFFSTYIKTGNLTASIKKAAIAGGCAAGYSTIHEFLNLKHDTLSRSD